MRGQDLVSGSVAGLAATVPMTVAMEAMFRLLPHDEQYALPPRRITAALTDQLGLHEDLDRQDQRRLTLVNHFAYGAAAAALYGPTASALRSRRAVPSLVSGMSWGLAVWIVSYLGLLPALGLLRPATHHPAGRNVLMIAAHLLWGAVLGTLAARMQQWGDTARGRSVRRGP